MPRGDGTGPNGNGPIRRGGRCQCFSKQSKQGLINSKYSNGFVANTADDIENQAKQLEKRAQELRAKANELRGNNTGG